MQITMDNDKRKLTKMIHFNTCSIVTLSYTEVLKYDESVPYISNTLKHACNVTVHI